MPRRNSSPVNRSSRRRNNTHRPGTLLQAWNSKGEPIKLQVLHSNHLWTTVMDTTTGDRFTIGTRAGM